ncbi:hypothetical protein GE09DRAFT_204948 [Coniochaeta sp. 2T2.1]|nr:hypothetical protein GE09DRAFT_204948 [Coniochaeta sp. 2T2.1]
MLGLDLWLQQHRHLSPAKNKPRRLARLAFPCRRVAARAPPPWLGCGRAVSHQTASNKHSKPSCPPLSPPISRGRSFPPTRRIPVDCQGAERDQGPRHRALKATPKNPPARHPSSSSSSSLQGRPATKNCCSTLPSPGSTVDRPDHPCHRHPCLPANDLPWLPLCTQLSLASFWIIFMFENRKKDWTDRPRHSWISCQISIADDIENCIAKCSSAFCCQRGFEGSFCVR